MKKISQLEFWQKGKLPFAVNTKLNFYNYKQFILNGDGDDKTNATNLHT